MRVENKFLSYYANGIIEAGETCDSIPRQSCSRCWNINLSTQKWSIMFSLCLSWHFNLQVQVHWSRLFFHSKCREMETKRNAGSSSYCPGERMMRTVLLLVDPRCVWRKLVSTNVSKTVPIMIVLETSRIDFDVNVMQDIVDPFARFNRKFLLLFVTFWYFCYLVFLNFDYHDHFRTDWPETSWMEISANSWRVFQSFSL